MATKKTKKTATSQVLPTREERIAAEKANLLQYVNPATIGSPERRFEIGEKVFFGGWQNSVILETFLDGKAYIVDCSSIEVRHGRDELSQGIRAVWWFDILRSRKAGDAEFFEPYRRGQAHAIPMESIFFMYERDGFVCDPTYQRGYVWTDFDREQLLTSIFERMEIGRFLFVRKHGFNYKPIDGYITYNTLHGEPITMPRYKDHTVTIIDGQQRLTTLINFYLDKFPYKGKRFSEFNGMDQHYFRDFTVHHTIIEEDQITRKELLRLFLQVNRGVPQTSEHLERVQKLYEQA